MWRLSNNLKTKEMIFLYCTEISGEEAILSEEESKHCIRVLRLKKGDTIHLADGRGTLATATITDPNVKKTLARIVRTETGFGQRRHHLHIAIAPTSHTDRFEWFLEKSTEIGIDEITPLACSRSERKTINTRRAERILISAMKQSRRAVIPKLNEVSKLDEVINREFARTKIITHCNVKNLPFLTRELLRESPVIILIGPEGDFTTDEVTMAVNKGFAEVSLGPFIYRSETAGIMACHQFNLYFGQ